MEKKDHCIFYLVSVNTGHWSRKEQAHLKFGHFIFLILNAKEAISSVIRTRIKCLLPRVIR